MFERYTEKARRTIFFARYDASQFGSPYIETEHLLLGLLRENKHLWQWLPDARPETIREWVEAEAPRQPKCATSVDLPLSAECKQILKAALDEADSRGHRHIGTEHLFLALFSIEECQAAKLLHRAGADATKLRVHLSEQKELQEGRLKLGSIAERLSQELATKAIEIHGLRRRPSHIWDLVQQLRSYNWHWHKTVWKPRDVVIDKKTGGCTFDLSRAEDAENFMLAKGGWTRDHCAVCRWELFESEDDHGTGYTNGRDWVCIECYEKFWKRPDFIGGSYSDLT